MCDLCRLTHMCVKIYMHIWDIKMQLLGLTILLLPKMHTAGTKNEAPENLQLTAWMLPTCLHCGDQQTGTPFFLQLSIPALGSRFLQKTYSTPLQTQLEQCCCHLFSSKYEINCHQNLHRDKPSSKMVNPSFPHKGAARCEISASISISFHVHKNFQEHS